MAELDSSSLENAADSLSSSYSMRQARDMDTTVVDNESKGVSQEISAMDMRPAVRQNYHAEPKFSQAPGTSKCEGKVSPQNQEKIIFAWRRLTEKENITSVPLSVVVSDEFSHVLQSVISSPGRKSVVTVDSDVDTIVDMCVRKTFIRRYFTYAEFECLIYCLVSRGGTQPAYAVFALYDLDKDDFISGQEFFSIAELLASGGASRKQLREAWLDLTSGTTRRGFAAKHHFIEWLHRTPLECFRRFRPRRLDKIEPKPTPKWEDNFSEGPNPGHVNDSRPIGGRRYFSRPASLPQLASFYDEFSHTNMFKKHRAALDTSKSAKRLTFSDKLPYDGTMRSHITGQVVPWDTHFVLPLFFRTRDKPGDLPLAPGAVFGESVAESFGFTSSSITSGGGEKRRPRDPDNVFDVRPRRPTTLEAIPW